MNRTYTPELNPDVLDRLAALRRRLPRRLQPPPPGRLVRRLPPRPDPGRRPQERRADGRPRPAAGGARRLRPRPGPAAVPRPEHLGRAGGPEALPGHDGGEVRRPGRRSSSSTTPPSPSRASTPSASSGSTAAPWARRPTASAPSAVHYVAPKGHYPLDMRLYLPGELAGRPEAAGQGRGARGRAAAADQGPDRAGAARPGPRRGAAGRAGGGRQRLRRLGPVPRRPGRARACTTSSA